VDGEQLDLLDVEVLLVTWFRVQLFGGGRNCRRKLESINSGQILDCRQSLATDRLATLLPRPISAAGHWDPELATNLPEHDTRYSILGSKL
jgi:hypothetical protein